MLARTWQLLLVRVHVNKSWWMMFSKYVCPPALQARSAAATRSVRVAAIPASLQQAGVHSNFETSLRWTHVLCTSSRLVTFCDSGCVYSIGLFFQAGKYAFFNSSYVQFEEIICIDINAGSGSSMQKYLCCDGKQKKNLHYSFYLAL